MTSFPPTTPSNLSWQKPHRGAIVLTLGILGLVVCGPCGVVAWVFANNDLREIEAGRMDPSGRQLTQAGKICGIIASCFMALAVLGMCLWFAFFGLMVVGGAAASGSRGAASPRIILPYVVPQHIATHCP